MITLIKIVKKPMNVIHKQLNYSCISILLLLKILILVFLVSLLSLCLLSNLISKSVATDDEYYNEINNCSFRQKATKKQKKII